MVWVFGEGLFIGFLVSEGWDPLLCGAEDTPTVSVNFGHESLSQVENLRNCTLLTSCSFPQDNSDGRGCGVVSS